MTPENRDKFIYIAGRYGQIVKFYNVEDFCADKIAELKILMPGVHTTIGTFYRFFVADLLPKDVKKLIYLDSDTIVNMDIRELWRIELGNNVLATIPEFENGVPENMHTICRENLLDGKKYFNAGVLLINLVQFRKSKDILRRGIKFIAENPKYECFDQDILNYCFGKNSISISRRFNILVEYAISLGDFETDNRICHYISSANGLGFSLDSKNPYSRMFLKYFAKTPWFNEETLLNLYEGVIQLHTEQKRFATKVSEMMSGKTRAFFVVADDVEAIRQFFSIKPDEEIITADSPDALQNMISSLKNSKSRKIFFLLVNGYSKICKVLIEAGFELYKDFINVTEFLSVQEGMALNSYFLIKAM